MPSRRAALDDALRDGLPQRAQRGLEIHVVACAGATRVRTRRGCDRYDRCSTAPRHPGAAAGLRQWPLRCRAFRHHAPAGRRRTAPAVAGAGWRRHARHQLPRTSFRTPRRGLRPAQCRAGQRRRAAARRSRHRRSSSPLHLVFIGAAGDTDCGMACAPPDRAARRRDASRWSSIILPPVRTRTSAMPSRTCTLPRTPRLVHARVQDESARATLFARTDAVLGRDARYERIDLELGAALSRHELNVRLEGEGAKLHANGVLLATGKRHLDTRLGIEHIARDTSCELIWRGLGAGRGRAVFHGGILIRAGADGSNAEAVEQEPAAQRRRGDRHAAGAGDPRRRSPGRAWRHRRPARSDRDVLPALARPAGRPDARRLLTAAFCREVLATVDAPVLRRGVDAARWIAPWLPLERHEHRR